MSGIERTITGTLNLSERYELSEENDQLYINDATISLVVPGDIFTNEGDDTVTISSSSITGEEGTGFYLGSGNDSIAIDNSTIDVDTLTGSGDDLAVLSGNVSIERQFSMGTGNDTLEVNGTLNGSGTIDFGAGNDTLKLDGGTLQSIGTLSNCRANCILIGCLWRSLSDFYSGFSS